MGKITSKYQVSIPKVLAEQLDIGPGDEIEWRLAGEELRVSRPGVRRTLPVDVRLVLFDEATERQAARNRSQRTSGVTDRGWKREDLYERGRSR